MRSVGAKVAKGDCTPLMEAAHGGHIEIVKLLIQHGADVNAHTSSGNTPLMFACAKGCVDVVRTLLDAGAKVEASNENGHTPLMEAASAGHVDVARMLLQSGANINTNSNEFKESALTLACYKGHYEMVRFLLEAGADKNHKTDEMHTALMEACMDGHVQVARLLLESGAQVNMPDDSFESPLTLAACGGHIELAMLLLENNANIEEVNDEGYTPLMEAAREGHEEMVALLLSQGAEINAQTEDTMETALTLACCGGFLDVATFLVTAGADVNLGASTPLMEAAQEGHLKLVQYLVDHGANVHAETQTCDTALTYACENGHLDVVKFLLGQNAELEHLSEGGRTPLMKAARAGHLETVQYLILQGANVNSQTTNNDHTPLSLACAGGNIEVVEWLLRKGANPLHKLKDNSSMLMEASKGGHTAVVKLLIDWPGNIILSQNGSEVPKDAELQGETDPSKPPDSKLKRVCVPQLSSILDLSSIYDELGDFSDITDFTTNTLRPTCELVQEFDNYLNSLDEPCLFKQGPGEAMKVATKELQELRDTYSGTISDSTLLHSGSNDIQDNLTMSISVKGNELDIISSNTSIDSRSSDGSPLVTSVRALLTCAEKNHLVSSQINPLCEIGSLDDCDIDPNSDLQLQCEGLEDAVTLKDLVGFQAKEDKLHSHPLPGEESQDYCSGSTLCSICAHQEDILNDVSNDCSSIISYSENLNDLVHRPVTLRQYNEEDYDGASDTTVEFPDFTLLKNGEFDIGGFDSDCTTESDKKVSSTDDIADAGAEFLETQNCQKNNCCDLHKLSGTDDAYYKVEATENITSSDYCGDASLNATSPVPIITMEELQAKSVNAGVQTVFPHNFFVQHSDIGVLSFNGRTVVEVTGLDDQSASSVPLPVTMTATTAPMMSRPVTSFAQNMPLDDGLMVAAPARELHETIGNSHFKSSTSVPQYTQPSIPPPVPFIDLETETESNHDTALTYACAGGHEDLVRLLLSRGADIEHKDKKGFTPLILASTAGHAGVVEILLANGADIEAQSDRTKDTPLSIACSSGRYEVAELLLKMMANKEHRNVSDYTPLSLAASAGFVNLVKLLLEYGAEINARTGSKLGISPLMLASMNGHTAAVKVLLEAGSDINAQIETNKNTALTLACFQGRHEVVSILLDYNANIEHRAKTGLTPLMEAAGGGFGEVGRVLLDKGADINAPPAPASRDTALTIAAEKGHYKFVQLLLKRGAQVDVKNKKGCSPVWLAANGGYLEVIQLLNSYNIDLDSVDNRKVSCLVAAFRNGHVKPVKYLVKHVTQFPSDQELTRYISTITDLDLKKRCLQCMDVIKSAKEKQAAEANKNATILLEELDKEKCREATKKMAAQRRREKKKQKKQVKREEKKRLEAENSKTQCQKKLNGKTCKKKENICLKDLEIGALMIDDKQEDDDDLPEISNIDSIDDDCTTFDISTDMTTIPTSEEETNVEEGIQDSSDNNTATEVLNSNSGADTDSDKPKILTSDTTSTMTLKEYNHKERSTSSVSKSKKKAVRLNNPANLTDLPIVKSNAEENNPIIEEPVKWSYQKHSVTKKSKKDEDWMEVVKRTKKLMVPASVISRLIGRNGSNINAIREQSGASIEIERQVKSHVSERYVTIRGSADAIKVASQLISDIIDESEKDSSESKNSNPFGALLSKTTVTVTSHANSFVQRSFKTLTGISSNQSSSGLTNKISSNGSYHSQWWQPSKKYQENSHNKNASVTAVEKEETIEDRRACDGTNASQTEVIETDDKCPPLSSDVYTSGEYTPFNNMFNSEWIKEKDEYVRGMNFASAAATGLSCPSVQMNVPSRGSSFFTSAVDASKAPGYRGANNFSSSSNIISSEMDLMPSQNTHQAFIPMTSISLVRSSPASLINSPVSVSLRTQNPHQVPTLFNQPISATCGARVTGNFSNNAVECLSRSAPVPFTPQNSALDRKENQTEVFTSKNIMTTYSGTISAEEAVPLTEVNPTSMAIQVSSSRTVPENLSSLSTCYARQNGEYKMYDSHSSTNYSPNSTYTTTSLPHILSSTGSIQSNLNPNAPDFSVRYQNYIPTEAHSLGTIEASKKSYGCNPSMPSTMNMCHFSSNFPKPYSLQTAYVAPYEHSIEKLNHGESDFQQASYPTYNNEESSVKLDFNMPNNLGNSVLPRPIGMERTHIPQQNTYPHSLWSSGNDYYSSVANEFPNDWNHFNTFSNESLNNGTYESKDKTFSRPVKANKPKKPRNQIIFYENAVNIKNFFPFYDGGNDGHDQTNIFKASSSE